MKTEMRKYEFTGETEILCDGTVLHRIRALIDIDLGWRVVKAGELGGWLEKETNLSHFGKCWVYGDAKGYGNARICGHAEVWGNAEVCDYAKVYGDAEVYCDAKVYGYAKICGNAMVCGDAEVYGDTKIGGDAIVRGINHIADNACGSWYMKRFTEIK